MLPVQQHHAEKRKVFQLISCAIPEKNVKASAASDDRDCFRISAKLQGAHPAAKNSFAILDDLEVEWGNVQENGSFFLGFKVEGSGATSSLATSVHCADAHEMAKLVLKRALAYIPTLKST